MWLVEVQTHLIKLKLITEAKVEIVTLVNMHWYTENIIIKNIQSQRLASSDFMVKSYDNVPI